MVCRAFFSSAIPDQKTLLPFDARMAKTIVFFGASQDGHSVTAYYVPNTIGRSHIYWEFEIRKTINLFP